MRISAGWAMVALLAPGVALAHRDLAGDVHPEVSVVDGMFVVRFTNNVDRTDFETVLTPNGEVTIPRRAAQGPRREHLSRFEARSSKHTYVVDLGRITTTGELRGHYSVRHTGPSGAVNTFDLRWSDDIGRSVGDAQAREDALVLLTFAPQDGRLRLDRFDPLGRQVGSLSLGSAAYVWSLPIASRIAVHRNGYLVAWVARPEEDGRAALNLSWWDPISGVSSTIVIEPRIDWNTSVSLGVIGDDVLVAYHGSPKGAYHGPPSRGAVIHTVHMHGLPRPQ